MRKSIVAYQQLKLKVYLALSLSIASSPCILPASVHGQALPGPENNQGAANSEVSNLHLDLSSTEKSLVATNGNPVTIQVGGSLSAGSVSGGSSLTISPGQLLTPAQYFALNQVLQGSQTILVGAEGQAVGGHSLIQSSQISQLGSLNIPQNVSLAAIGYNAASPLNIAGNVNILGSFYSLQNSANIASVLNLGNLSVGSGGLLSGHMPLGINFGSDLFASAGMSLNVAGNVLNMGTISTPGTLNISAGGSIINQSAGNLAALISAQNINLMAGSGQFVNSALITANGNLNISTLLNRDLSFQNTGGVLEAIGGSINFRDALFDLKQDLSITGGDFISKELNIYNGTGFARIDVGEISGLLNISTGAVHMGSNSTNLNIGSFDVKGDPVIYNQGGDVSIAATTLSSADLVLLAKGKVTATGNITLNSAAGQRSGNLTVVGGANFNVTAAPASPPQQSLTGVAAGATSKFEITGASGSVGTVSLQAVTTSATAGGTGVAGNVNIATFNSTITTGAITANGLGAAGSNGNVSIIGPGTITTGAILSSTGTTTASGGISIVTATPKMVNAGGTAANVIITPTNFGVNDFWTVTNGFVPDFTAIATAANVSVGALTTNGGNISVLSGNNITLGGAVTASRAGVTGNGGNIAIVAGARNIGAVGTGTITGALPAITSIGAAVAAGNSGKGGNITLASGTGAALTVANSITSSGATKGASAIPGDAGDINIVSGAGITVNTGNTLTAQGASSTGSGGNVFLSAGTGYNLRSAVNPSGFDLNLTGASGTAGPISLNGTAGINTRPATAGANANGGRVQLAAFGGNILINTGANIQTGGLGTGTDGSVTAFSNSTVGNAVQINTSAVNTVGAKGGLGNITIATQTPFSSAISVDPSNGDLSSNLALDLSKLSNGDISLTGLSSNGGNIRVIAGKNIALNSAAISANRTLATGAGGNIEIVAGATTAGAAGAGIVTKAVATANGVAILAADSAKGGNISIASGKGGDLTITGNISANGAGLIGAAGAGDGGNVNIISALGINQSAGTISANGASSTGSGGNIFLSSGVDYNIATAANALGNTVTITGASGKVGTMTLSSAFQTMATTVGANGAGGNIQLGAFGGGITIANGTLFSMQGRGTKADGQLTILSDLAGGKAVSVTAGSLGTNTGTGAGNAGMGHITIATATPYTSTIDINPETGARSAGLSFDLANLVNTGDINLNGLGSNGGNIRVIAGGNVSLNGVAVNANRTLQTGAGGNIEILAGARTSGAPGAGAVTGASATANGVAIAATDSAKGGNITIASGTGADLSITNTVSANGAAGASAAAGGDGGLINIISGKGISQTAGKTVSANAASTTGSGGSIFLSSGVNYNVVADGNALGNKLGTTGVSGKAGTMTLAGNFQVIPAGANGAGGTIQLGAFGGAINITNGAGFNLQGRGTGADGQLTILSDLAGATAISVTGVLSTNTGTTKGNTGLGHITIATATPYTSNIDINPETGTRSAGLSFSLANLVNDGDINLNGLGSNGGNIRVIAGGNVSLNNATINASKSLTTGVGGNVEILAGARTSGAAGAGVVTQAAASANGFAAVAGNAAKGGNITIASGTKADLTITGNIAAGGATNGASATPGDGGNINIISGAGINQSAGTVSVNAASSTGNAGSIFLSSGANYNVVADGNALGNKLTITGASGKAGTMTLSGAFSAFNATAGANGAGGSLQLGAFGGGITIANGANVSLQGRGNKADGQLTILSDLAGGKAVSVTAGSLRTDTGTGAGVAGMGHITVSTATPYTTSIDLDPSSGTRSAGLSFDLANIVNTGNLNFNGLGSNGGNIRVIAGGNVSLNSGLVIVDRTLATGNGGNIEILAGARQSGTAGTGIVTGLTAQAIGKAIAVGDVAKGGNITVASGTGGALTITNNVAANGAVNGASAGDGSGGNITIVSGAGITHSAGTISADGAANAGAGGSIFLSAGTNYNVIAAVNAFGNTLELPGASLTAGAISTTGAISVRPTTASANASGGRVQMAAFGGGVTIANAANMQLAGRGTGKDANLTIISDLAAGAALTVTAGAIGTNTGAGAGTGGLGDIAIATAKPFNATLSIDPLNAVPSSNLTIDFANLTNGDLSVRGLNTNGGVIRAIAGGNINLNNTAISATRTGATGAGGTIEIIAGSRNAGTAGAGLISGLAGVTANGVAIAVGDTAKGGSITLAGGTGAAGLTITAAISANGIANGAAAAGAGDGGKINIISGSGLTQNNNISVSANGAGLAGAGGEIFFASGANYNVQAAANPLGNTVELTGASLTAGPMSVASGTGLLSVRPQNVVNTNADGGRVSLAAFGSGITIVNGANIQVGGRGSGKDGNVSIFSNTTVGNAVSVTAGVLDTTTAATGGTGGLGSLTIATQVPYSSTISLNPATGALAAALAFDPVNLTDGSLNLRGLTSNGGNILAVAGNNLNLNSVAVNANRTGAGITGAGGNIELVAGARNAGTAGAGVVSGLASVTANAIANKADSSAKGGNILIASGTGAALTVGTAISANGAFKGTSTAGDGGSLNIASANALNINANLAASANGATSTGGSVLLLSGTNYNLLADTNAMANKVNFHGAFATAGALTINAANTINVQSLTAGGSSGLMQLGATGGAITVNNAANLQLAATGGAGTDGSVRIVGNGGITLTGKLDTSGAGTGGLGNILVAGTVPLFVTVIDYVPTSGSLSSNISENIASVTATAITANGLFTNGGTVAVVGGSNMTLNASGGKSVSSFKASGSGDGGNIQVINGLTFAGTPGAGVLSVGGEINAGSSQGNGGNILIATGTSPATLAKLISSDAAGGNFAGGNISIVAGNDLTLDGQVSTRSSGSSGTSGSIFLASGAGWELSSIITKLSIDPAASGASGVMILNGTLNSSAQGVGGTAGNVAFAAFGAKGSIDARNTLSVNGNGAGANGSITAIAQGQAAAAGTVMVDIDLDPVATGGKSGTGGITLATAAPLTAKAVIDRNLAQGPAISVNPDAAITNSAVRSQNLQTDGAPIYILSANSYSGQNLTASGSAGAGGRITILTGIAAATAGGAGTLSVNNLDSRGNNGAGGNILLASGSSAISVGGFINSSAVSAASAGNAGSLSIVSGGAVTVTGDIDALGAAFAGNGGALSLASGAAYNIDFVSGKLSVTGSAANANLLVSGAIASSAGAGGGDGGAVQLAAFGGGGITASTAASITSSGKLAGLNGQFSATAGGAISLGSVQTAVGGGGTGGGGNINIGSSTPLTSFEANIYTGAASGTYSFDNSAISATGDITTRGLVSGGGNINVTAGRNADFTSQAVNASRTAGTGAGGSVNLIAGANNAAGAISNLQDVSANALSSLADTGADAGNILIAAPTLINAAAGTISANGAALGASSGKGGRINIVSGGGVTAGAVNAKGAGVSGNGGSLLIASGNNYTLNSTDLTITNAATAGGGNINLNGALDLSGSGTSGNGGALELGAFAGTITISGSVNSKGAGTGTNGNLTLVAGGAGGNSINVQGLDTAGGSGGAGKITMGTTAPLDTTAASSIVINRTSGAASAGFAVNDNASDRRNASVSIGGDLATNGAEIYVFSGKNIDFNGKSALASRTIGSGAGGSIRLFAGVEDAAGAVSNLASLASNAQILAASGSAAGGCICVSARGGISITGGISSNGASAGASPPAGGNGGTIALVSGAGVSVGGSITSKGAANIGSGGSVTVAGGNQYLISGGTVTITSTNTALAAPISISGGIDTRAGAGGNGNGGLIQLGGFGAPGSISVSGAVTSGGAGTGSNGNLIAVAQGPVTLSSVDTTGGTGGGGSVTIGSSSPLTGAATVVVDSLACTVTGTFSFDPAAPTAGADMSLNSINTDGGAISINSGRNIDFNNGTVSSAKTSAAGDGGAIAINAGLASPGTITNLGAVSSNGKATGAGGGNGGAILITATGGLALSAASSITANGAGTLVHSGNAGAVNIVSGADLTLTGSVEAKGAGPLGSGGNLLLASGASYTFAPVGKLTITAAGSGNSGILSLAGSVDTRSELLSAGSGGNVQIGAFGSSGNIGITGSVRTNGHTLGTNGSVTAIAAGTNKAVTITLDNDINTCGVCGITGGAIALATSNPLASAGGTLVIDTSNGAITSGAFSTNFSDLVSSSISTKALLTSGAAISVIAGKGINFNSQQVSSSSLIGNGGNINLIASALDTSGAISGLGLVDSSSVIGAAGNITIAAGKGGLTSTSSILANSVFQGGNINIVSRGDLSINSNVSATASGGLPFLGSGNVLLASGVDFTVAANDITLTAPSGASGALSVGGSIDTRYGGGLFSGHGGDVQLGAYGAAGTISVTGSVHTAGTGTGTNGDLTAIAQGLSLSFASAIDTTDAGSDGSGGGGAVTLSTNLPSSANVVINRNTGAVAGGFSANPAAITAAANISTKSITTDGAAINIFAGNNIDFNSGSLSSARTNAAGGAGGNVTALAALGSKGGSIQNLVSVGASALAPAVGGADGGNVLLLSGQGGFNLSANITSNGAAAAGGKGNGGAINVISGSDLTIGGNITGAAAGAGTSSSVLLASGADYSLAAASLTINAVPSGKSAALSVGGNVDISAPAAGGSGGSLQMGAFGGTIGVSGNINTSGKGAGTNGSVTAIAGANNTSSITLSNDLSTCSGCGTAGGAIVLATTSPLATPAGTLVLNTNTGAVTSGSFGANLADLQANASISTKSLSTNGGDIMVLAGKHINFNNGSVTSSSAIAGAGNINLLASAGNSSGQLQNLASVTASSTAAAGGNVLLSAGTAGLSATGIDSSGFTKGGNQNFVSRGGINLSTLTTVANGGAGALSSGNISASAGYDFNLSAGLLSITGPSGTNGSIVAGNIDTHAGATGTSGNGGKVSFVAAGGSISLGSVDTYGFAAGTNGDILGIASAAGASISTNALNTGNAGADGSGGGGAITLATTAATGTPIDINRTTGVLSGSFSPDTSAITAGADISTKALSTDGANIFLLAGLDINFNNNSASSSRQNAAGGAAGAISIISAAATNTGGISGLVNISADAGAPAAGGAAGGNILVAAGTAGLNLTGNISSNAATKDSSNANAGAINIISGGDLILGGSLTGKGTAAGQSSNLLLASGASYTLGAGTLTITAAGSGGSGALNAGDIDVSAAGAGGSGGNVQLAAFGSTGVISLSGTVNTSGLAAGANGSFTAAAAGSAGTTISIANDLSTCAGCGTAGGAITIATTNPLATPAGTVVINTNTGAIASGKFDANLLDLQNNASVSTKSLSTNGGNIFVLAGTSANFNGGSVQSNTATAGANAGNISIITAAGNNAGQIQNLDALNAESTKAAGGNVLLSAGDGGLVAAGINSKGFTAGGNVNLISRGAITAGDIVTTADGGLIAISSGNVLAASGSVFTLAAGAVNIGAASGAASADLSTGLINTSAGSSALAGNGGNVVLVSQGGHVTMGDTQTQGSGLGVNGLVLALASAGGASIKAGLIDTANGGTDGSGGGGGITLATTAALGTPVSINSSTGVLTGSFSPNSAAITAAGNIETGALSADGANIYVLAGNNIDLTGNSVVSSRVNAAGGNAGNISLLAAAGSAGGALLNLTSVSANGAAGLAAGAGGNVVLSAGTGGLDLTGSISATGANTLLAGANGGNLAIVSRGDLTVGAAIDLKGNGIGGSGGSFTAAAGASFSFNGVDLVIGDTPQTPAGANISLNGSVDTRAGTALVGGAGGNIQLAAFGNAGTVTVGGGIQSGGQGLNANGNVNIFADAETGPAITLNAALNTCGIFCGPTGGAINLSTTAPLPAGGSVSVNATSGVATGAFSANLTAIGADASIQTQALTTSGGAIDVLAGASIDFGGNSVVSSSLIGNGGNINLIASAANNAGSISGLTGIDSSALIGAGGNVLVAAGTGGLTLDNITTISPFQGGSVSLVGRGDVTVNAGINTKASGGFPSLSSGDVFIASGSTFILSASKLDISSAPSGASGAISIGGNIDTRYAIVGGFPGSGGDVSLLAFGPQGSASVAGLILTAGAQSGTNGDVLVLAQGSAGTSINVGDIFTNLPGPSVAKGGGGKVQLGTSAPITGAATVQVDRTTAQATGLPVTIDTSTISANASISANDITSDGALISLIAGSDINFNSGSVSSSKFSAAGAGGNINIIAAAGNKAGSLSAVTNVSANALAGAGGAANAGGILLVSGTGGLALGGNISAKGSAKAAVAGGDGGPINIVSRGDLTIGGSIDASGGSKSGNGGGVLLSAGADYTLSNSDLTVLASSAGASGQISVNGPVSTLAGTLGNGSGGKIQIGAFGAQGTVTVNGSLDSAGNGTGNNGDVVIVAAGTPGAGTSIQINSNINTGSQGAANNGLGGSISIGTTLPLTADLQIARPGGAVTGGFAVNTGAGQIQASSALTGNLTTNGAAVVVVAGANITTGDIVTDRSAGAGSGNVSLSAGASIQAGLISANGVTSAGATVQLTAGQDINTSGSITASGSAGGTINVQGGAAGGPADTISIGADITAEGASGKGGSILLNLLGSGNLGVSGNISADALAAADGGSIDIRYNSATQFDVGSASANGVSGSIHADAKGAGNGGSVSIRNNNAGSALNIQASANISASSGGGGNLGTLTFDQLGQAVTVNSTAELLGQLFAHGGAVEITTSAAGTALTPTNVASSAGSVVITASGAGSVVNINGPVSSKTTLDISADSDIARVSAAGIISSNALATLTSVNGSIGASATPIFTQVPTLSASATAGSAFFEQQSGNIAITSASVQDNFELAGALNSGVDIAGQITASSGAGIVNMSAKGSGSITQSNQLVSVSADAVILSTATGNIGDIAGLVNPIRTNTGVGGLTLTTSFPGPGGAFVSDLSGSLNINTSKLGGSLVINSQDITTLGDLSAGASITFNTPNLHNSNTIAANAISIINASGVNVDDPLTGGTINSATTITATASAGDVLMMQDNWFGTVTGSAKNSFVVISCCSGLTAANITAGSDIALISSDFLTTGGTIVSATGKIQVESLADFNNNGTLNAQAGGIEGLFFSGNAFNNGTMLAGAGDINLQSFGGDISFAPGSNTTASANIIVNSSGDINFGANGGAAVVISAGQATTKGLSLMPSGSVSSNGMVQAQANGNINVFENVSITSRGGAGAAPAGTGDLSLIAGANLAVGANNVLTSFGGYNMLGAAGTVSLGDSDINSVAKITDAGGTYITGGGAVYPNTTGGGIGVLAGSNAGAAYISTQLDTLMNMRTETPQYLVAGTPFNTASPNLDVTGGSIVQSVFAGVPPQINPDAPNFYNLSNAVVYFENQSSTLTALNTTFNGAGSAFIPQPPPTPPILPSSGGSGGGLTLNLPGFVNTGVPTDRIEYSIKVGSESSSFAQTLNLSDRRSWFVAEGPSQPYILDGDNDTIVVGQEGTRLALVESRTLVLDNGRVAILVGAKADLAVETAFGVVNIPAGAVVLIDSSSPEHLSVLNLTSASVLMYASSQGSTAPFSINAGEELVLSLDNPAASYVPRDGFSRSPIKTFSAKHGNLKLSKNTVDRTQVLSQERLLSCGQSDNCLTKRRVDALKAADSGAKKSEESESLPPKSMSDSGERFNSVAFNTPGATATAAIAGIQTLHMDAAQVKHRGAEYALAGDRIELKKGELLVLAKKKTMVSTGDSTIVIAAGTLALLAKDDISTKVRNVWEPKAGSLKQLIGSSHVEVGAGQESILAKNDGAIASVHASDGVGRRRVRHLKLESKQLSTAEVSLITVLADSPLLKAVARSAESGDKGLKDKVMKMAACIQTVTASHGNYTNMSAGRDKKN